MKKLVLYVFHIYNERVDYFLKNCLFYDKYIDFIVISNGNHLFEVPPYVTKIIRDNIGYDFGGWSEALFRNNLYENYDYFIFVNSSVIGPYLSSNNVNWTDIYINGLNKNNVKLFGSTINTCGNPTMAHVQSYIFSMNKNTLDYLIDCEIFSTTNYAETYNDAILQKEILMSRKVIENGWNIGSLLKHYDGFDFTFTDNKPDCVFLADVMYNEHKNKLWNEYDLVFIKGNRITCALPNVKMVGFIILRHVNNTITNNYWVRCYDSIRKYYPENIILIIDDNSDQTFITAKKLYKTHIINSEFHGRGELLPYYYYLNNKFFDVAVIIHDSVFINKHVNFHTDNYNFLWDFEHDEWDQLEDESRMINTFKDNDLTNFYNNKNLWKGCFGSMSIITHDYLTFVNSKYNISKLIVCILNRYNRCSFERVIACLLQINITKKSLLGNIHEYCPWGVTINEIDKYQHLPIIKVWSGR